MLLLLLLLLLSLLSLSLSLSLALRKPFWLAGRLTLITNTLSLSLSLKSNLSPHLPYPSYSTPLAFLFRIWQTTDFEEAL